MLRWLHLSDIHFKDNEEYETQRMRDSLMDKLKETVKNKPIQMVFITGDLVYQGGEYDRKLEEFINEIVSITGISYDDLFIVPGNHDLSRTQARTFIIQGLRGIKGSFEEETIQTLGIGFKKYNDFGKRINKDNANVNYALYNRENVNILTMNTSLTAGTNEDEGNLVIDKKAFYEVIKELKDKEKCINIAIGHHPITCFASDSQKIIFNNFNDYNVDLYLCGHIHKAGYEYDLSGQRVIPTCKCGGGMVDDYATTTFAIGEIDIDNKCGKVTYYKWLQAEECWTKGGADGRRALSGEVDIDFERFKICADEAVVEEDLNEDEFRRFVMHFHEKISTQNVKNANIDPKDVFDKFRNMKCNKSVEKQYDLFSRYFQVIDEIMGSTLLTQIERESIPNIVISEYNKIIGKMSNGNEIIEEIVQNIFNEYASSFQYSNTTLKTYFKILVYWSIYECDIFNDEL